MRSGSQRARRLVLIAMAAAFCLAAAVAIAILVLGEPDYTGEQLILTAVALLLFGAAAAAGTSVLDASRRAAIGWLCIAVALAGFVVTVAMTWTTAEGESASTGYTKASGTLFVLALALADVSLLARRRDGAGSISRPVVLLTQGAAVLLAAMLTIAILGEIGDDTYLRWVAVAAILWLLGTALVPIARRLGRTRDAI